MIQSLSRVPDSLGDISYLSDLRRPILGLKRTTLLRLQSGIEYYDIEALKEIGQAIGTVLQIDTHTAIEARGRYARLCVQVDIDKPLIYTILIGRFQQLIVYEGIGKLCFSCGRVSYQ